MMLTVKTISWRPHIAPQRSNRDGTAAAKRWKVIFDEMAGGRRVSHTPPLPAPPQAGVRGF